MIYDYYNEMSHYNVVLPHFIFVNQLSMLINRAYILVN